MRHAVWRAAHRVILQQGVHLGCRVPRLRAYRRQAGSARQPERLTQRRGLLTAIERLKGTLRNWFCAE